jgi:uncharacterized protein YhfF/GNAT superfamily N-acetyltransferase
VELPDKTAPKDDRVERFWNAFREQVRLPPDTPYQAWYFGDSPGLAHELTELVLHGPKRATAALGWGIDAEPDTGPVPDGYSVVTEFDGTPRAVIRTTGIERRAFRDVDPDFAWTEGEGDRTLDDWRAGHWSFFTRECAGLGRSMSEDAPVVLERFELLYPFEQARNPVDCGPRIVPCCLPGGLLESSELQIDYYERRHGFGPSFGRERRQDIALFLEQHDAARDGVWLLVDRGRVLGSVVIDGRGDLPELRWFIVSERLHGQGWGRRLMACAMAYCAQRHQRVVLHTFSALAEARRLYEAFGFVQVGGESTYAGWGPPIVDQCFEWQRDSRQSGTIRP